MFTYLHLYTRTGAPVKLNQKNPNSNPALWPSGRARLTKMGKQRAYAQGMITRMRYRKFLTENPKEIYARSSFMDRCLESAELALAGMYIPHPPNNEWSREIHWQPIPVYTLPEDLDSVLEPDTSCPEVNDAKKALENTVEVKELRSRMKPIMDLATRDLGTEFETLESLGWLTYDLLPQEKQFCPKCQLPGWYNSTTKAIMANATIEVWKITSSTPLLKEISAGPLLKEIVNRFENQNYKDREDIVLPKKAFLYSTHDKDMASLLNTLGIFFDQLIGYSDNIYFELHQDSDLNEYYIRVFYIHNELPEKKLTSVQELFPDCSSIATNEITRSFIHLADNKKRCTLAGFKALVGAITQHNYRSMCRNGTNYGDSI